MIKCLKDCLDKKGNWNITRYMQLQRNKKEKLDRAYKFLWLLYRDNSLSLNEMYKLYRQLIFQPLLCLHCGKTVHIRRGKNVKTQFGFALFCSIKCQSKSNYRKEAINLTCTERYGGVGFGNEYHKNKACKTMKEKYGVEYYVLADTFEEERTKTFQEKYGVTSPMKSSKILKTHQDNMSKKHGVHNPLCKGQLREQALTSMEKMYGSKQIMATTYIRKLKENKGEWLPLNQKTYFEVYCLVVDRFTVNSISNLSIPNIEKRKKYEYTLDHIYSKKQGFVDNIPPFIIGSIVNLKVIPHSENSSKRDKCGMTKEQLFTLYYLD